MYNAVIPFRAPVTLTTDETDFIPAMKDLASKYRKLRDDFELPASCMPDAVIYADGERFGVISYKGRVYRRSSSPFSYASLIAGAC
jgi:hypothetical protein